MKKIVFLMVFIIIAILLMVCNAMGIVDSVFTNPLIWFLLIVCNISATIDFYVKKKFKWGAVYTLITIISAVFLTMSGMEFADLFK